MSKDNKELLKYLGIIFITVLLTYKLPHDSYSIIQYIIRPIRLESGAIYLSGLIPIMLLFIGIKGLFGLERFADKSKILIFIIVIILVVPVMKSSLNVARTTYCWVMNDELKAVDLVDADVNLIDITDNEATIKVNLSLIDYGRSIRKFKVRMNLPESWKACFNKEYFEFEEEYMIHGNRNVMNIKKEITVQLASGCTKEIILNSQWYWETFKYELYNEEEVVMIIVHGI